MVPSIYMIYSSPGPRRPLRGFSSWSTVLLKCVLPLLKYAIVFLTISREDDFSSNQSELKFLRIQLQAIEAQCSQYIPLTSDKELAESITKWKFDWEEIDRKSKARRKKCQDSRPNSDDSGTIVNGS